MRFTFADKKLQDLYVHGTSSVKYPPSVVDRFFKVIQIIEEALDQREFYAHKSLHFEALKGRRGNQGEHSMRLNKQYRLIVAFDERDEGLTVVVRTIEDYH